MNNLFAASDDDDKKPFKDTKLGFNNHKKSNIT